MKRNVRWLAVISQPPTPKNTHPHPRTHTHMVCMNCNCCWKHLHVTRLHCAHLYWRCQLPSKPSHIYIWSIYVWNVPLNDFNWHIFNGGQLYAWILGESRYVPETIDHCVVEHPKDELAMSLYCPYAVWAMDPLRQSIDPGDSALCDSDMNTRNAGKLSKQKVNQPNREQMCRTLWGRKPNKKACLMQ